MLRNIMTAMHMPADDKRIKRSRNCIFDGILCPRTRALLAVGLGCDVYKSGIRGVTKVVLYEWLLNNRELYNNTSLLHFKLVEFFGERYSCDNTRTKKMTHSIAMSSEQRSHLYNSLSILIDSFMYEPCNFVGMTLDNESDFDQTVPIYIHNENPQCLHIYLKAFAKGNVSIPIYGNVSDICTCVGIGDPTHVFLLFEGKVECFRCSATCCKYCNFKITIEENNTRQYCSQCFLKEKFIPNVEIEEHVPIEEMLAKLSKVSIEVRKDDNLNVILALYDHHITRQEVVFDETVLNSCPMPFEKSNYLKTETKLIKFNLIEGGLILRNSDLNYNNKLELISLLAKLVKVKSNNKNRNHSALPLYLVEVANAARIRGGDRLLARALRHSVDHDRTEITEAKVSVIKYNESIGLNIITRVRASMKNAHYGVEVSFNSAGIISNTCTCRVGGLGVERIICIHILPVIQQLAVEIYVSLATDILYHLNQEWGVEMEGSLTGEQVTRLHSDVILLIRASNKHEPKEYSENNTVTELLRKYDTGTERRKKGIAPPLNKTLLGPLRKITFVHPSVDTKKNWETSHRPDNGPEIQKNCIYEDLPPMEDIPYTRILNMCKFIREQFPFDDDAVFSQCVGHNIVALRASKSKNLLGILDQSTKADIKQLLDDGNILVREPSRRTFDCTRNNSNLASTAGDARVDESESECDSDSDSDTSVNSGVLSDSDSDNSNSGVLSCNNNKENEEPVNDSDSDSDTTVNSGVLLCNNIKENDNKENEDPANENEVPVPSGKITRQYQKCCVPLCSQDTDHVFYRRLPACPHKNLSSASNKVRKTYAVKAYNRKEWLRRLGLTGIECPPHSLYCNKHNFESTLVTISWRSLEGRDNNFEKTLLLPKDENAPGILTREDRRKRQIKIPIAPVPHKRCRATLRRTTPKVTGIRWCYYVNCVCNSSMPDTFFSRVPPLPGHAPNQRSNNSVRFNYAKRVAYRSEFLRRIGAEQTESRCDIRICHNHRVERLYKSISYILLNGSTANATITIDVPSAFTSKSNMSYHTPPKYRHNKGSAYCRFENNYVAQSAACAATMTDYSWAVALQDTMNHSEQRQTYHDNRLVLRPNNNSGLRNKRQPMYGIINRNNKITQVRKSTVVQTYDTTNHIISSSSGFRSMSSMICFICILCNGDITKMRGTDSPLTWLEEWLFYFERVYGRTMLRMVDCRIKFKIGATTLRKIFKIKLRSVIEARKRWPMFVSFREDEELRDEKWNATYQGKRIIMWDNTNVRLAKPSNPNLQRNTFSEYYDGNVGKGSVFIQLCGWMGTHELWEGAVSDTDYFSRSGILQIQEQYVRLYDPSSSEIKWINMLDRGFKVTGECFSTGEQFVLQPTYCKPGEPKFTANDTQLTAAVAADRAANERAVKIAKLSKYISDGYKQTVTVDQMCDVWLAWSFQANFMYKPVL